MTGRARPRASVVIPSRNNRERLSRTLESIARSDVDLGAIEVVVADDGSTDGTGALLADARFPFALVAVRGDWSNQSAATNAAIRASSGAIVLSSSSDVLFAPDLIRRHVERHERSEGEALCVLGSLPYLESIENRPFLVYLVSGGFQFAYYLIRDPLRVPPSFLYAPNFSVRREGLDGVGLFDESFPFGCQDTDLGIRLVEAGVRIVHDAAAIAKHDHPQGLRDYFRRQRLAGEALVRLHRKHPEHADVARVWGQVLGGYLGYSEAAYERDLEVAEILEERLAAEAPDLAAIWGRAFLGESHALPARERGIAATADLLFHAYERILTRHWAEGFLAEARRVEGDEVVSRRLLARYHGAQLTLPVRRLLARRGREIGLDLPTPGGSEAEVTFVLADLRSYEEARASLLELQLPAHGRFAQEAICVLPEGALGPDARAKLEAIAEVVVAHDRDDGVAEAIRRASGRTVVLATCRADLPGTRAVKLALRLFEKFPTVGVLTAPVPDRASGVLLAGRAFEGEPTDLPDGSDLLPVEVGNPELFAIRREIAHRLLDAVPKGLGGVPWNEALCALATAAGLSTWCVAALAPPRVPGPRAEVAAAGVS